MYKSHYRKFTWECWCIVTFIEWLGKKKSKYLWTPYVMHGFKYFSTGVGCNPHNSSLFILISHFLFIYSQACPNITHPFQSYTCHFLSWESLQITCNPDQDKAVTKMAECVRPCICRVVTQRANRGKSAKSHRKC